MVETFSEHLIQPAPYTHYIALAALVIVFIVASFKDYIFYTVPISACAVVYALTIIDFAFNLSLTQILFRVISAIVVFAIFYLMAKFMNGGGGDAIAMPLITLQLGFMPAMIIIIGDCVLTTLYALIRAAIKKEKISKDLELPFIPGAAICLIVFLAVKLISGGSL